MRIRFVYPLYFESYKEFEEYKDSYGYVWSYTVWQEVEKILEEREKIYY